MFQLTTEWIPSVWHPENYPNAWSRAELHASTSSTAPSSRSPSSPGNIVFCTLAGYGLAKFRFPGDRFVLLAILSTLMLPLEVTLVPTFLVIHKFGWINTYQGIIGPLLIDAFGVFLMRQSILVDPHRLHRGRAHRRCRRASHPAGRSSCRSACRRSPC